ncbi:hypothetical protein VE03_03344 [Pseudogymnoascus sp. 23342-1-I1]|nr:hypothetical protein VE03_03344 [Pseudogymnoascus sp. 23342-1-I1]
MDTKVDVFICGSGSAGLCAATWLAKCGLTCKIVDSRSGPMEIGQADGVQCRTVEVFDSFGIAEELLRESYHVIEVAFWASNEHGGIERKSRVADTAPGLSRMPHVILNQARVNQLLLDAMRVFNGQKVDYGYLVKNVEVDSTAAADPEAYCVSVTTEKDGHDEVFRAKYALGCDGAHSSVRKSLGFKMVGDSTNSVWGVMDVYPRTNFPDIRKKCALQTIAGSLLIIPREGGSLVRFYTELPSGTVAKDVTVEHLHSAARRILHPYDFDVAATFWWSAYSIGQRLADHFSKDNRVFLTGDSCHTHSPKAGQGMNVSLQDGYNIGWKLAAVLKGQASPNLLKTYNIEREKVAADLISFDRTFAKAFSSQDGGKPNGVADDFSKIFVEAGRYTAGLAFKYDESSITRLQWSNQRLATTLEVGMRFPSAQVVRLCDKKAMQLATALPSDGRWRIVIFAGDIRLDYASSRLRKLSDFLSSSGGPVRQFTPASLNIDSFIEPILVLSGGEGQIEQEQIPAIFWPESGKWKIRDLHKTFIDYESYNSGHGKAYEFYGIDPEQGAVAIVRPDQYISMVVDINDYKRIGDFFRGFCGIFWVNQFLNWGANNNFSRAKHWNPNKELVLITGGSSGIGASVVTRLAKEGNRVVVLDISPLTFCSSRNIIYYKCDLSDMAQIKSVMTRVREENGSPTVLVNNAGLSRGFSISEGSYHDNDLTFRINLLAPFLMTKECLPGMVASNHGHILNVASMSAFIPPAGLADYAASKAGMVAFHESLGLELRYRYQSPSVRNSLFVLSFTQTPLFAGKTKQNEFLLPLLHVDSVADEIVDTIYHGYSRTVFMPGLMRYVAWIRGAPDWVQHIIRKGTEDLEVDFKGRQVIDPETGRLKENP